MDMDEIATLARTLMDENDLCNWTFEWDRGQVRAGCCHHNEEKITLSKHIVPKWPAEEVRDVILHEIAHALTPWAKHGWQWRQECIRIGARPDRCYEEELHVLGNPNYFGLCPNGHLHWRYRSSKTMQWDTCQYGKCRRGYNYIKWYKVEK